MSTNRPTQAVTLAAHPTRTIGVLGLAAAMAGSLLLSGCNTTAGAGQDVKATGQAITRGANDVKQGL